MMLNLGMVIGLIKAMIKTLSEAIVTKLDAPETAGTANQVLTSDGNGGQVWAAIGQGDITVDNTLSVAGSAADAKKTGDEISDLKSAISAQSEDIALQEDAIPGTTQTITFDADGNVQRIVHSSGDTAVRTDVFTFGTDTITEVRTLASGASLTIVTNTDTLVTTVTMTAA